MKRKGLYVLATVAMLALAAGCGSNQREENPNNQVTEATTPTEAPEATATPEPTATPAPTATPVPANYMEANGIEILGAGSHICKGYIWFDEEDGKRTYEPRDYETMIEAYEEDNGDGTKTISVTMHKRPHIDKEKGWWWSGAMGGFVDLKSGKAFLPLTDNMLQATVLKQDDKEIEMKLKVLYEKPTTTYPYYTEQYTLICPSDYEDAGFYMTSPATDSESFSERMGLWKKLNYIRHGETDLLVFGVNKVLDTMVEKESLVDSEGNYFEENGFSTRGKGKVSWLGTEALYEKNSETGAWDVVSVETKEVETEFSVTERSLGDGTKQITGTFTFIDVVSEEEVRAVAGFCGIVDKKTGMVYKPQTYFLGDEFVIERNGKEITLLVGSENSVEQLENGNEKATLSHTLICPEDYDDAVFFLTGRTEIKDWDYSEKAEAYPLSELENGDTEVLFFR